MAKLFVSLIKRNISTIFEAVFGKLNFWRKIDRRGPYKIEIFFDYLKMGIRKYFLAKLFVPLIKRNLSTTFEAVFGKLNFWRKIDRRGPYKIVKIWYYLKMGKFSLFCKKIFFGKIICFTHQKKHFYNIWGSFWKIEFLTENWQARKKIFLAKLFVPLIKSGPYKIVNFFDYLKMG